MPAHYRLVDGLALPAPLAGHPALELCNTWAGWDGREPGDYLASYEHLAVWAGVVGLLPADAVARLRRRAARQARAAAVVLDRAREFRLNLYLVLTRPAAGKAFEAVAAEVAAAAAVVALRRESEAVRWEVRGDAGLAAPLAAATWSAAELLTSAERSFVRTCPGPGCGWLFLDPRGRRRWCSMAACGNRAKARRFAARHRAGP